MGIEANPTEHCSLSNFHYTDDEGVVLATFDDEERYSGWKPFVKNTLDTAFPGWEVTRWPTEGRTPLRLELQRDVDLSEGKPGVVAWGTDTRFVCVRRGQPF